MKKIFLVAVLGISALGFGQVTIEKTEAVSSETAPAPANQFVSIEFGNATGGAKGIVLPWVTSETAVQSPVPGTLVYDSATKKVKLATASTAGAAAASGWIDFSASAQAPLATTATANNPGLTEKTEAKAIIGAQTSAVNGILILETPAPNTAPKAMILPRVSSYADIVNPAAGMIVYVTSNDQLAVFNGKQWTFWKGN